MEKIEISQNMSVSQIMQTYSLPKATAWRAKQRGYFVKNYHGRVSEPMYITNVEDYKHLRNVAKWVWHTRLRHEYSQDRMTDFFDFLHEEIATCRVKPEKFGSWCVKYALRSMSKFKIWLKNAYTSPPSVRICDIFEVELANGAIIANPTETLAQIQQYVVATQGVSAWNALQKYAQSQRLITNRNERKILKKI